MSKKKKRKETKPPIEVTESEPEQSKDEIIADLQRQLENKERELKRRAFTVTAGDDPTVSKPELQAIVKLFPAFSLDPSKKEMGDKLRMYVVALGRLQKFAGL